MLEGAVELFVMHRYHREATWGTLLCLSMFLANNTETGCSEWQMVGTDVLHGKQWHCYSFLQIGASNPNGHSKQKLRFLKMTIVYFYLG
jgi:hypothetical protein